MMTRVLLTFLVGLLVSLGALVSGGPVLAKNWNLKSDTAKPQADIPKPLGSVGSTYQGVTCQPEMTTQREIKVIGSYENRFICHRAMRDQKVSAKCYARRYVIEMKRRNIDCGLGAIPNVSGPDLQRLAVGPLKSDELKSAARPINWYNEKFSETSSKHLCATKMVGYLDELKRRGFSCQDGQLIANNAEPIRWYDKKFMDVSNIQLCQLKWVGYIVEARRRGLSCSVSETKLIDQALEDSLADTLNSSTQTASASGSNLPRCPSSGYKHNCFGAYTFSSYSKYAASKYVGEWKNGEYNGQGTFTFGPKSLHAGNKYVGEWKDGKYNGQGTYTYGNGRAAKEGIWKDNVFQYARKSVPSNSTTQIASSTTTQANTTTSAELEAERLRKELAALKAKQQQQQQTISSDTKLPTITIASVNTKGKQGIVRGRAKDNIGIAEVTIDGTVVPLTSNGNFEYSTFVPSGGLSLKVQATDLAGLTSMMSVTLERNAGTATAAINFDRLNPTMGKRVKTNKDALALIVGVADYENTPAKAVFADSDAMMFRDYASEKLGIPESRIKTLVNDGADERELLLSVKSWLARASKQGKSDVYVFFAGHGLASDNGKKMYLLPYDGSPELLDDTAILRDRLFSDIASANPRSVTVFLDTCYSGTTRGTDMLIASRPIAIKALKQSVPDNFTVMTAAAGDQTAKPLEEAKHGMFSYFLMKGMEGEADKNQDNKITAGELHSYVQSNVVQQSSGSQTPELQGDAERVLVRFQ